MRPFERGALQLRRRGKIHDAEIEQIGFQIRIKQVQFHWVRPHEPLRRNGSEYEIDIAPAVDVVGILWVLRLDRHDVRLDLDLQHARAGADRGAELRNRRLQVGFIGQKIRMGVAAGGKQRHCDRDA